MTIPKEAKKAKVAAAQRNGTDTQGSHENLRKRENPGPAFIMI